MFEVSPIAQTDFRVLGGQRPSGAYKIAQEALERAKMRNKKSDLGLPKDITVDDAYIAGVADGIEEAHGGPKVKKVKKSKTHNYRVTTVCMITTNIEAKDEGEAYDLANGRLDAALNIADEGADFELFYSHAVKDDDWDMLP